MTEVISLQCEERLFFHCDFQDYSFYFSELLFWSHTLKSTLEGSDRKCSSVIIISMTSPVLVLFFLLLLLSAFLVLAAGLTGEGFIFLVCEHQTNIRERCESWMDSKYKDTTQLTQLSIQFYFYLIPTCFYCIRLEFYLLVILTVSVRFRLVRNLLLHPLFRRTRLLRWCPLSFHRRRLLGSRLPSARLWFGRLTQNVCGFKNWTVDYELENMDVNKAGF